MIENQKFEGNENVASPETKPSASGFGSERRRKRSEVDVRRSSERRTERNAVFFDVGQAIKSARGMPWDQEPMKDVTSCDKLRGAANEH